LAGYIPKWFTRPQTVTHPSVFLRFVVCQQYYREMGRVSQRSG